MPTDLNPDARRRLEEALGGYAQALRTLHTPKRDDEHASAERHASIALANILATVAALVAEAEERGLADRERWRDVLARKWRDHASMCMECVPDEFSTDYVCTRWRDVCELLRDDGANPGAWGGTWPAKNPMELKGARRVLSDGSVFEDNWVEAHAADCASRYIHGREPCDCTPTPPSP